MTEETAVTPTEAEELYLDMYSALLTSFNIMANRALEAEREVAALTTQRDQAEALSYVPGAWQCAKCNLRLIHTNLHVHSGTMSANNEPQQCVNGCGPMWRVSERDDRQDAQRHFNIEFDKRAAAEAQRDELQKRIGYTDVPLVAGGANLDDSLRMQGLMWAVLLIAEAHAKNGLALDKAICDEARQFLENRLATGTEQATECETNGTEGLRAELDAAKRALAELQAAIAPYHSRLISNFAEGCYMYEAEKVDLDALNAALAAKSTEHGGL